VIETDSNRPVIALEAKRRIKALVKEIEKLQKQFGVEIGVMSGDTLGFLDVRRTDTWNGYGAWDAMIFASDEPRKMRVRNLYFEDFSAWGK
jgi:hypothetical protein